MANLDDCIQTCLDCRRHCLEEFTQMCLEHGGEHVEKEHAVLMLDCIDICATCADFMTRRSSFHHLTCKACSEVCSACADSCDKIGMSECAAMCRKCAESCGSMAA